MNLKNQKGTVLVETAIILPLLLLIIFGILEFGRLMYITNTLNNAAREGARRAAVSPLPINVNSYVTGCIPFDKTGLAITTTSSTSGVNPYVKVTVTLPFKAIANKIIPFIDGKILRGEATMRYEL